MYLDTYWTNPYKEKELGAREGWERLQTLKEGLMPVSLKEIGLKGSQNISKVFSRQMGEL